MLEVWQTESSCANCGCERIGEKMYIPPFWCGVIATLIAEFVFMNLIAALCGKKNGDDEGNGKGKTRSFEDN